MMMFRRGVKNILFIFGQLDISSLYSNSVILIMYICIINQVDMWVIFEIIRNNKIIKKY